MTETSIEYSIKSMAEAKAYLEHPVFAFTTRKLKVDGDTGKALEFSKLIKKG